MTVVERRGGLGRGLDALIPTGRTDARPGQPDGRPAAANGVSVIELPLDRIRPNPRQPRTSFDDDRLAELAASVREVGLLQPVIVRPTGEDTYELVMGERRWRACQLAGSRTVPAIVRDTADRDLLRDALLENLHREGLNPLEEAAAYAQLLDDFGSTHDELGRRVGKSRSQVSNTLRLLQLPPAVQRRVAAGVLSAGHARALLALDNPADQDRLAGRIVAEGLSVRAVEEAVVVGEPAARPVRRPRRVRATPIATAVAEALAERLETRVSVDVGRTKGRLVVEFGSPADLERIMELLAPEVLAAAREREAGDGADPPDGGPPPAGSGGGWQEPA